MEGKTRGKTESRNDVRSMLKRTYFVFPVGYFCPSGAMTTVLPLRD